MKNFLNLIIRKPFLLFQEMISNVFWSDSQIMIQQKSTDIFISVCFFLQPLNPNATGNCTTVDGEPMELAHGNGTHCTRGVGLTETEFNLLYSVYAVT